MDAADALKNSGETLGCARHDDELSKQLTTGRVLASPASKSSNRIVNGRSHELRLWNVSRSHRLLRAIIVGLCGENEGEG